MQVHSFNVHGNFMYINTVGLCFISLAAVLGLVEVGRIVEEDGNVTFEFIEGESDETIWKGMHHAAYLHGPSNKKTIKLSY